MSIADPETQSSSSPPASATPPFQFHQFSLLPLELQRKIWRALFPPSRTISLSYNITSSEALSSPPPITLSICSESRAETLLLYTLIYRCEFSGSRGKTGGNCGILLSKAMRQPICIDPSIDIVGFSAGDLCGTENVKARRRFVEWMRFLDGVDKRILRRTRGIELMGLDWENTMYVHLKYQEELRCKEMGEEYEGQGGVECWEELNYGALVRFAGLREVRCRYKHVEYMGNFEDQLKKFLGFHREVWGGTVPSVKRAV
ncbi:afd75148-2a22-452c-a1c6-9e2d9a5f7f6d-CDS [Sclerotinia trifoliorum]|uniref:Afd75148-2a22-452c-a1c6-9e2d9a5f7f6d-CDS n=1 Tax=Sclerotinia trifoliorum TaxID=28548 RepID=A0A8H2VY01_9HELO|nr:afd75148-2a22-452c-a1c6-9e2d9a5f7f6d-CDS [Sclerotinia trifoliorum]